MNKVCVSDTPFAPLGLAPGGINVSYTPFASPRLWSITSQHQRCGRCIEKVSNKNQAPAVRKVWYKIRFPKVSNKKHVLKLTPMGRACETRQYHGFKANWAGFTRKSREHLKHVLIIVFQSNMSGFASLYPTYTPSTFAYISVLALSDTSD